MAQPHLDLAPASHAEGTIALPGSKSISNRTLLLAALATGSTSVRGLLVADDVDRMLDALATLGVDVIRDGATRDFVVHGVGGNFPVKRAALFLGNAGTVFRPLTAALALAGGEYTLAGVPRMHERPIGDLVDALRALGAGVRYDGVPGYPPLTITGSAPPVGIPARVSVRGDVSSQFLSALLMALPLATSRTERPIAVDIVGDLISKPYVAITTNLMRRFGVAVEKTDWTSFSVPPCAGYVSPGAMHVEGDASSASYFLAAGVIGGGPVRVTGVGRDSIQGDIAFADALAKMGADIRCGSNWIEARSGGALTGVSLNCVEIPDAAMTLAVVALFARGPTTLSGIASWRVKETDRISAMATELRKLGAQIDTGDDCIRIAPPAALVPAAIDTYDDHRIAMCFSLASLGGVPVRINDPGCVKKTFPGYFDAFRSILR